ncbi:MAG: hypothetical protein V3U91_00220 [Candidatus Aminicenantaceae bacterium]
MDEKKRKDEAIRKLSLDTEIPEFLEIPELNYRTRKHDHKAARIQHALHFDAYESKGIKTLRDLKNDIKEKGWLFSRTYKGARFRHMGENSVKYLNNILGKYGIEPFGPLYGR